MKEQFISIEQFVSKLVGQEDGISYGYRSGWLESQDVTGKDCPLDRKTVARIVHQFLLRERKEQDEVYCAAASKLQDLYDCRVCVSHMMQVYVKGIMDGFTDERGRFIFGMNGGISESEANELVERVFSTEKRTPQTISKTASCTVVRITEEKALCILQGEKEALLIDVRTEQEYEHAHLKGASNLGLVSILKNPYAVSMRRDVSILLYCSEGYQSEIAAKCLADAGYERIYFFAWKQEEDICTI